MRNFNEYFNPFLSRFQAIELTTNEQQKVESFVTKVIEAKNAKLYTKSTTLKNVNNGLRE